MDKLVTLDHTKQQLDKNRRVKRKAMTEAKAKWSKLYFSRVCLDTPLKEVIDEIIIEVGNIRRPAYHGGQLTGACCRRFLKNIDQVMKEIEIKSVFRMNKQRSKGIVTHFSVEKLRPILKDFTSTFKLLNQIFTTARLVAPTEEECILVERNISSLMIIWEEKLHMTITTKLHLLHSYVVPQIKIFGGLGDKIEEWVERLHQEAKKYDHITSKLRSYKLQQECQPNMRWEKTSPDVERQSQMVAGLVQK